MRRGVAVTVSVAAAAAAAGGGWLAGRSIKSPDQAALEAEPPPASLVTVEVEFAELTADVVARADVGYDEPVSLSLAGAIGDRQSALAVTWAPERGAELNEGEPAIEIAGRPVFVLSGPVPVYRDLRPQDRGPDVEQLETALARLGHFEDGPDELWDGATSEAVSAWYEAAGYQANGISDSEEAGLRSARRRLHDARDALRAAQRSLDETLEGPTDFAVSRARTELATALAALEQEFLNSEAADGNAARALADAERAHEDAQRGVADAERAVAAARRGLQDTHRAVAAARRGLQDTHRGVADAERAVADAERGVADAEHSREEAARRYGQAGWRWESAQAGVHPDTGAVPTAQQHETLRLAVRSAGDELAGSERAVETAERGVADAERAVADAERAVAEAERGVADALRAVGDAERAMDEAGRGVDAAEREVERRRAEIPSPRHRALDIEQARLAVRSAEERVIASERALDDLLSPADAAQARRHVADARSEAADAAERLTELEAAAGVWLPAGELIVLNRLPVRVDLLTAERGSTVSGAFMTVTGSKLAVRGSVSERDVDRVREGTEARIDDRSSEVPIVGTIRLVDQRSGTRGVAPDRHYVEIVADGIPEGLVGRNVRIVIPVGGTDGAVLVVPTAAVSASADGSTRVEVERSDGSTDLVAVELGLSTGGRVEVTPLDGALSEGDRVVVGMASGSER